MTFILEKLVVYQKALDLADRITNLTSKYPKGYNYLTDQLNRAVVSISTNLAEGNGRWHKNDRKQFFYIARGSLQECLPLLELSYRKKLLDQEKHQSLKNDLEVISRMMSGLIAQS